MSNLGDVDGDGFDDIGVAVGSAALLWIGQNTETFPLGGHASLELPLSLDPWGGNGCWLLLESLESIPAIIDTAGRAPVPVHVPNNPLLAGQDVFFQWAVMDSSANPLGVAASNGLYVTIQP